MSKQNEKIVLFGKYDLIEPYYLGLARVKIGDVAVGKSENFGKYRWGIISAELEKNRTVAFFATVQNEGDRKVMRNIAYYNLDMIISVGYRRNCGEMGINLSPI